MAQNVQVTLLIVSRWPYGFDKDRWCYLGWDVEHHILVRPIPSTGLIEPGFSWPSTQIFEVGEKHLFNLITCPPIEAIPLPHTNNDIHVIHARKVDYGYPHIPDILSEIAKPTIADALGITDRHALKESFTGSKYVEEGVDCQSCGVYQCTKNNQNVFVIIELGRPLKGFDEFDPRCCFVIEVGKVSVR